MQWSFTTLAYPKIIEAFVKAYPNVADELRRVQHAIIPPTDDYDFSETNLDITMRSGDSPRLLDIAVRVLHITCAKTCAQTLGVHTWSQMLQWIEDLPKRFHIFEEAVRREDRRVRTSRRCKDVLSTLELLRITPDSPCMFWGQFDATRSQMKGDEVM
jgi:hypothetical protein